MINYRFEKQAVYVIADPHGFWDVLKVKINTDENMRNCILIIAGDNGIGFARHETIMNQCELLNKTLANNNIICFMIRGNHDNPSYYDGNTINMSNLHAIPDYTIISVGDENILCVGGAISIDRVARKADYMRRINCLKEIYPFEDDFDVAKAKIIPTHYNDETPIFNIDVLENIHTNGIQISHVVTHTAPRFAFQTDDEILAEWYKNDPTLEEDKHNERKVFTNIYAWLLSHEHPLKTWTYGHFHKHNDMNMGECKFTALHRCDEIFDYFKIIDTELI